VGKSSFLQAFMTRFGGERLSTRELILARKQVSNERGALQQAGDQLDAETNGKWVADGVAAKLLGATSPDLLLVDAVRINQQVSELRSEFGDRLIHVHLTASAETLENRYAQRAHHLREFSTYSEAKSNNTERFVDQLATIADFCFNTEKSSPDSIARHVAMYLGYYSSNVEKLVDVIVGAQFGSEGKGNICAYLAPRYNVLMRVGGPNAGHKVAFPRLYRYIQLPSGTAANVKAKVLIGAGATIWVPRLLKEALDHELTPSRLSIDPQAVVINQGDRDYEDSLKKIGSTKQGVGSATARKILGRDGERHLGSNVQLAKDVDELKPFIRDTKFDLERAYAEGHRILLEGTQGTDLSLHHGLYPHVTSRETTASGCLADAGIGPRRVDRVTMVMRTYPIRVGGTSGDLPNETTFEAIASASGLPLEEIKTTEVGSVSGNTRRIAELSLAQIRRSAEINTATDIALTFADYISVNNQGAKKYEELTTDTRLLVDRIESEVGIPVKLISKAFNSEAIIER
jgi:adenylosuccinate synthase